MRYRLGILSGVAITGIVALGLATGITGSGTVEAARPSVTVTPHELMVAGAAPEGGCNFVQKIGWEGSAYAHKSGHYTIFLWTDDAEGHEFLVDKEEGIVPKGDVSGTIYSLPRLPLIGSTGTEYRSRIVFYTSRGKGGAKLGTQLVIHQEYPVLVC